MSPHQIEVGSIRLVLDEDGSPSGSPVVVLHGFAGSAAAVTEVSGPLADAGHRVLVPDLIGHGRSSTPDELAPYAMAACVHQVEAACQALDLGPIVVVGYSMGGRLALQWAVRHPQRIERLVTIGATPGLDHREDREARRRDDDSLADRIEAEGVDWFDQYWSQRPIFATQRVRVSADRLGELSSIRRGHRPEGLANSLRGMGTGRMDFLAAESLARVQTSTLVLAGADDQKFLTIGRELAGRLGRGRFEAVPDAGHAAHLEAPLTVGSKVTDFLVGR